MPQFHASKNWDYQKTCKLLDYIEMHPDFEKPTADLYYRDLVSTTKIDVDPTRWDLLRKKLRQLQTLYIKTEDWLQVMGTKAIDEENVSQDEINAQVKKMCPHYTRLRAIFGKDESTLEQEGFAYASFENKCQSENALVTTALTKSPLPSKDLANDIDLPLELLPVTKDTTTETEVVLPDQELQKEWLRLEWKKLHFERYKFDKLYEMKKLQIERNYELKKMRIEQRVCRDELKLVEGNLMPEL